MQTKERNERGGNGDAPVTSSGLGKEGSNFCLIKFPYNARSDWLKQRPLSENKVQVNDIKVIPLFCISHPYCA